MSLGVGHLEAGVEQTSRDRNGGRAHPVVAAVADGIGALCGRSRDAGRERRDERDKEESRHGWPSRWRHGGKGGDGDPTGKVVYCIDERWGVG